MNRAELMSNPEADREPREEEQALTPERAAKLIFYSYRFSQGEPYQQHDILQWFHEQHPEWDLAGSERTEALDALKGMLERFAEKQFGKSHADMSLDNLKTEQNLHIRGYLDVLLEGIDPKEQAQKEKTAGSTPERILRHMIDQDRIYNRDGRPGSSPARRNFSFTPTYILAEKSAGMPEYDALFAALRATLREKLENQDAAWEDAGVYGALESVVAHFNETHPDNPVSLEAFGT